MQDAKSKSIDDLNQCYTEADQCDQELFAEQRSNILLVSGEHYTKRGSKFWNRVRDTRDLTQEQKLRLTKNHTQKITKTYTNNITKFAPGVMCAPQNPNELSDQKSAQLNQAVWKDAVEKYKLKQKHRMDAKDFTEIGEIATKIFWDPNKGVLKDYEPKMGDDGQPMMNEDGTPAQGSPIFSGDFVFERIYGFNLLRDPAAKTMAESRYLIVRKMIDTKELEKTFEADKDKLKMISETRDETYMVFDMANGGYEKSKGQTMLREHYYRPCMEYPNGYYYICTSTGILAEGELPYGKFPIVFGAFDEMQTSPRGHSIVKVARPYQAEINRSASKMAEHQITLGDDKLLIQQGTKISSGGQVPGVRAITFNGMAPTFLQGRDGSQYLAYMNAQISEMYAVCNVAEDTEETKEGQLDPYAMLYKSMRNKKKFSMYAEKFEQYLIDEATLYLELAKHYLPEETLIYAVGKNEQVNISEFKNQQKMCYQISLEPVSDDIESMLGKQLVLNHALQYVGSNLDKEEIGKILRNMPFANVDESFSDLTMSYDAAVNIILALDRGEQPMPNKYDDHKYMIRRLVARQRQADFQFLDPHIQQNYVELTQMHEQAQAQIEAELQRAEAGYIPTGGYLVVCDFYVPDPSNPDKTQRARVPYQSMEWLMKKLEEQGGSQASLQMMNPQSGVEMSQMVQQDLARGGQMPPANQGMVPQPMGPGGM